MILILEMKYVVVVTTTHHYKVVLTVVSFKIKLAKKTNFVEYMQFNPIDKTTIFVHSNFLIDIFFSCNSLYSDK